MGMGGFLLQDKGGGRVHWNFDELGRVQGVQILSSWGSYHNPTRANESCFQKGPGGKESNIESPAR